MKRAMMMAVVTMLAVPALASAQASQVTATATVDNFSELTGTGNLAFGSLSRTTDNVIDATGVDAATRSLSFNHNVRVTFDNVPTNLTANSGALSLPVSLMCAAQVGAGSWSTAAACSSAQLDLDVGTTLTSATLGFGGTIAATDAAAAVAASYTGTLDIVITAR